MWRESINSKVAQPAIMQPFRYFPVCCQSKACIPQCLAFTPEIGFLTSWHRKALGPINQYWAVDTDVTSKITFIVASTRYGVVVTSAEGNQRGGFVNLCRNRYYVEARLIWFSLPYSWHWHSLNIIAKRCHNITHTHRIMCQIRDKVGSTYAYKQSITYNQVGNNFCFKHLLQLLILVVLKLPSESAQ